MKLTAILMLAAALQVSANGFSQKVTLNYKHAPVKKVFKDIIRQTGISIIFSEGQLRQLDKVSINIKDAPIEEVLRICFKNTPYKFRIVSNTVVISQPGADAGPLHQQVNSALAFLKITGTVLSVDSRPLADASVVLKGTSTGTKTDANGRFTLDVPGNSGTLIISFVGYTTKEIPVAGATDLRVVLTPAEKGIDEVIVVGYGTQKKANLTAAVTQVDARDFKGINATGVGQAIQGRVPGMQMYRSSGAPGASVVINIRGIGSFTNNSPLVVVDGVPAGSLNTISPDEVESVTVLKDAAASAIYGANGANGVILVTTKAGKIGRPQIDYSYKAGFNKAAYMPRLLNGREFALLQNEARINAGQMPLFTDDQLKNMGSGTDWRDAILQTGIRQEHYISANGGATGVKYLLSANYLDESGIAVYSWFKRLNIRTKVDAQIGKRVDVGIQAQYTYSKSQGGADFTSATNFSPTIASVTPDGRPGAYSRTDPGGGITTGLNPLYARQLTLGYNNFTPTHYLLATAYGQYKLFSFLKLRSSITYERSSSLSKSFNPSFYFRNYEGDTILSSSRLPQNRSFSESAESTNRYLLTNTLTFNKTFGSHNVSAVAGYEAQKISGESISLQRTGGFPTNDWLNFGSNITSQVTASGAVSGPETRRSWFGRVNYDYMGKYLFEGVIRRDGASRFGPKNRWGTFPSASVGWRISEEAFFKAALPAVNNFMFRASYGLTGNSNIPNFYYISRVTINEGYAFGNQPAQIGYLGQLPNTDIRWETNKLLNIGIDAAFLNQRLSVSAEYYSRRSEDLLTNVTIPGTTGINGGGGILGTQIRNIGILTNKGVELLVKWNDNINRNLSYNLQFTGSYNTNKVLELNGLVKKQFGTATLDYIDSVGLPYHSIWGYKAIGVWQNEAEIKNNPHRAQDQPGDLRFADVDGNGVINENDRTVLGNSLPKFTYGLAGGLNYKTFDFNFLFQGDWKRDYLQYGYGYFEFYQQALNNYAYALNRWHGEGTSNLHPRLIANSEYIANQPSSYYVQDGSYLRLRHIELGYSIPKSLLDKASIKNIRVYIGADNLLTFTKYYGLDPEQSGTYGRDGINYPQARTYIVGLNATF